MNFPQVLRNISTALDRLGIAYMLTGSFACAYYGLPRSTQDIDLVIAAGSDQLRALAEALPSGEYYVDANAALEAHKRESMFNVIDLRSGWKIDMIIRKSRSFSQEEFGRRQLVNVQDVPLFVASAEDVVIAKLEWAKLGQAQRQIEDAAGILKVRSDSVDWSYLDKWIRELDLTKQWSEVKRITVFLGEK